jgi:hypothetical protein
MKNGSCSATIVPGSAALPFVISTEAQRSGEISVWMLSLGNVFRQSESWRLLSCPDSVEGGWPLRVRGMLEHMLYLELGDARG